MVIKVQHKKALLLKNNNVEVLYLEHVKDLLIVGIKGIFFFLIHLLLGRGSTDFFKELDSKNVWLCEPQFDGSAYLHSSAIRAWVGGNQPEAVHKQWEWV